MRALLREITDLLIHHQFELIVPGSETFALYGSAEGFAGKMMPLVRTKPGGRLHQDIALAGDLRLSGRILGIESRPELKVTRVTISPVGDAYPVEGGVTSSDDGLTQYHFEPAMAGQAELSVWCTSALDLSPTAERVVFRESVYCDAGDNFHDIDLGLYSARAITVDLRLPDWADDLEPVVILRRGFRGADLSRASPGSEPRQYLLPVPNAVSGECEIVVLAKERRHPIRLAIGVERVNLESVEKVAIDLSEKLATFDLSGFGLPASAMGTLLLGLDRRPKWSQPDGVFVELSEDLKCELWGRPGRYALVELGGTEMWTGELQRLDGESRVIQVP